MSAVRGNAAVFSNPVQLGQLVLAHIWEEAISRKEEVLGKREDSRVVQTTLIRGEQDMMTAGYGTVAEQWLARVSP